jgi:hypothetical protein
VGLWYDIIPVEGGAHHATLHAALWTNRLILKPSFFPRL